MFTLALLTGVQLPFWQRHQAFKDVQIFCVWLFPSEWIDLGLRHQCVPLFSIREASTPPDPTPVEGREVGTELQKQPTLDYQNQRR